MPAIYSPRVFIVDFSYFLGCQRPINAHGFLCHSFEVLLFRIVGKTDPHLRLLFEVGMIVHVLPNFLAVNIGSLSHAVFHD